MNTKEEISTCQSFPGVYRFLNPTLINPSSPESLPLPSKSYRLVDPVFLLASGFPFILGPEISGP